MKLEEVKSLQDLLLLREQVEKEISFILQDLNDLEKAFDEKTINQQEYDKKYNSLLKNLKEKQEEQRKITEIYNAYNNTLNNLTIINTKKSSIDDNENNAEIASRNADIKKYSKILPPALMTEINNEIEAKFREQEKLETEEKKHSVKSESISEDQIEKLFNDAVRLISEIKEAKKKIELITDKEELKKIKRELKVKNEKLERINSILTTPLAEELRIIHRQEFSVEREKNNKDGLSPEAVDEVERKDREIEELKDKSKELEKQRKETKSNYIKIFNKEQKELDQIGLIDREEYDKIVEHYLNLKDEEYSKIQKINKELRKIDNRIKKLEKEKKEIRNYSIEAASLEISYLEYMKIVKVLEKNRKKLLTKLYEKKGLGNIIHKRGGRTKEERKLLMEARNEIFKEIIKYQEKVDKLKSIEEIVNILIDEDYSKVVRAEKPNPIKISPEQKEAIEENLGIIVNGNIYISGDLNVTINNFAPNPAIRPATDDKQKKVPEAEIKVETNDIPTPKQHKNTKKHIDEEPIIPTGPNVPLLEDKSKKKKQMVSPFMPKGTSLIPINSTGTNVVPLDPTGPNTSDIDPTGPNRSGIDPTGPNTSGIDPTGPNTSGIDPTGPNTSGIDPTGPNTSGIDPTGPNTSGIDPTGPNTSGIDPTGPNTSGIDPTGPNTSGIDPTGPNTSGIDPTGPNTSGIDPTGPNHSQPDPPGSTTKPKRGIRAILQDIRKDYEIKQNDGQKYARSKLSVTQTFLNEMHSGNYLYNIVHIVPGTVKAGVSLIAKLSGKLMTTQRIVNLMENMGKNIDALPPEDLETLWKEFRGNFITQERYPKALVMIVQDKMREYALGKVEAINIEITNAYRQVFAGKTMVDAIDRKLRSRKISAEDKQLLKKQKQNILKAVTENINLIREKKIQANELLSGGLHGLDEDIRATDSKMNYVGYRFAKDYDLDVELEDRLTEYEKAENKARELGDDKGVLDAFLHQELLLEENTKVGVRDDLLFFAGKVTIGKKQYSPLAEALNYSQDPFLRDFLTTIALTSAAVGAINAINVHKAAQEQVAKVDAANAKLNQTINNKGQELVNHSPTFRKGMQAQSNEDVLTSANALERQALDKSALDSGHWMGGNYNQYDQSNHALFESFNDTTQQTLTGITNRLSNGSLTETQALQEMVQLQQQTQSTLESVLIKCHQTLSQYRQIKPQFDLDAPETTMQFLINHSNSINDMNQAMLDSVRIGEELLGTSAEMVGQLPNDLITTLAACASSALLAYKVSTTMSAKYGNNKLHRNAVTDMMEEYEKQNKKSTKNNNSSKSMAA